MRGTYSDFERQLLVAAAKVAEETGEDMVNAREVFERFYIPRQPRWLGRAIEGFVSQGWATDTRTFGSEDDWDIFLNAAGFRAAENMSRGLRLQKNRDVKDHTAEGDEPPQSIDEIQVLSEQLAPAANRMVTLKDNQPRRVAISHELGTIKTSLIGSNQLDPAEKADLLVSLDAASEIVEKSDTWLVGAMKYLVFDRVRKAFEHTIEDAIRLIVLSSLATLATIILALI